MTVIRYSRTEEELRLWAEGHATGSERVCAAVSGLLYALLGYLENIGGDYSSMVEDGSVVVRVARSEKTDSAFDLVLIGLLQIEKAEPEYIKVTLWK